MTQRNGNLDTKAFHLEHPDLGPVRLPVPMSFRERAIRELREVDADAAVALVIVDPDGVVTVHQSGEPRAIIRASECLTASTRRHRRPA